MTLNRCFLILLALIGLSWIALWADDLITRADDRAFYVRAVAPQVKSGAAFRNGGPIDQALARTRARLDRQMLRSSLFFGGLGLVFVWAITSMVRTERFWSRRNSAARPADATAGERIAEVRQIGGILKARTDASGRSFVRPRSAEVEIDVGNESIVFRGFTFVTSFVGNRPTAERVLRFEDILGGRIGAYKGGYWFSLRTTAGAVQFTDTVRPFESVTAVLLDVAEWNRSNPSRYAAALRREPKIKVPWYGWTIIGAALLGLMAFALFLWNLSPR